MVWCGIHSMVSTFQLVRDQSASKPRADRIRIAVCAFPVERLHFIMDVTHEYDTTEPRKNIQGYPLVEGLTPVGFRPLTHPS